MNEEELQQKKKRSRRSLHKVAKCIRFGKINVCKYFTYERVLKPEEMIYPNYNNVMVKGSIIHNIKYKICNICFGFANYTCPRCTDRYCSKECFKFHNEIKCIKYLEL